MSILEIRKTWAGKTFECNETGERLTIPEDVVECDFFTFGKCFIDVGRWGSYSRAGGSFQEITEDNKDD